MKNFRRIFVVVMILALVFSIAACKGNTPGGKTDADPNKIVAGEYLIYKVIDNGKTELLFSELGSNMDTKAIKEIARMCNVVIDKDGKGTMAIMSGGSAEVSFDPSTGKVSMTGSSGDQVSDYKFEGDELHLIEGTTTLCLLREDSKEWDNIASKN